MQSGYRVHCSVSMHLLRKISSFFSFCLSVDRFCINEIDATTFHAAHSSQNKIANQNQGRKPCARTHTEHIMHAENEDAKANKKTGLHPAASIKKIICRGRVYFVGARQKHSTNGCDAPVPAIEQTAQRVKTLDAAQRKAKQTNEVSQKIRKWK